MPVTVRLHDTNELWKVFHKMRNEMIVTKTGRKMFPKLEFTIEGLDPDAFYGIVLQMEQVDDHRYKFQDGDWSPAGRGEHTGASTAVAHHDGVMTGAQWMRAPVHFERLKITNNPQDTNQSHVFLHSMHKYIPVITIYQLHQTATAAAFFPVNSHQTEVCKMKFHETEFITVTAYQNEKTKALKIKHNPYAKGFREGGDRKRSSPRTPPTDTPIEEKPMPELLAPNLLAGINIPSLNPFFYNSPFFNPYLLMGQMSPYRLALPKPYPM